MNSLVDKRFTGLKHFWSACVVDRPKSMKKFEENIALYADEGEFSTEEKIAHLSSLIGQFPLDLVMDENIKKRLYDYKHKIAPLGEWENHELVWFIPREILNKKTKNGKKYWVLKVTDSSSKMTSIRCWGVRDTDVLHINRPYMAKLDYNEDWGFSTRSILYNFKLLG